MQTIRMPLAYGYINGPYLVIPECPLCGQTHSHSSIKPGHYKPGDLTTRVSHCRRSWTRKDCAIQIVDDVGPFGRVPGISRKREPRRMPTPEMVDIPVSMWGAR